MPDSEPKTLGLDDRPTVGQVIAIVRQVIAEERWHRRLARAWHRMRRFNLRAAWFRLRMRHARIVNARPERIRDLIHAEARRVALVVERHNAEQPREQHVRGKVVLPRGVFVAAVLTDVPDTVDVVWPTRRSRR